MSMPRTLKVLIIGCGNIAGGFDATRADDSLPYTHAGAYSIHGGFDITACIDPDPIKRARFSERWKISAAAGSLSELDLEPGSVEVISICSPTACHSGDIDAAIRLAPRVIFCEKPVSPDQTTTEALVRACAEAGALMAVNHTRRWAPDVKRLKGELDAGTWGKVRSVSAIYNKGVLNNGSHMLDLLLLILGPLRVLAAGLPEYDHWLHDPSVPAMLISERGVPVMLSVANASDYALFELQIVTEQGLITMEDGGLNWRIRRAGDSEEFKGYRVLGDDTMQSGEYAYAMYSAVSEIYDAITAGAELSSDGCHALAAQILCEQILNLSKVQARNGSALEVV